jgi:hypothetical protein
VCASGVRWRRGWRLRRFDRLVDPVTVTGLTNATTTAGHSHTGAGGVLAASALAAKLSFQLFAAVSTVIEMVMPSNDRPGSAVADAPPSSRPMPASRWVRVVELHASFAWPPPHRSPANGWRAGSAGGSGPLK